MNKGLKVFGIFASLGMLIVLIQGALVTQTGSGDACGTSWPLCYDQVIPQSPTISTLIEYTHRLVSGVMGLVVIILSVWAWIKLGHLRETKFLAVLAIFAIIFQGLLGAAAVVWGQSDAVMALHFGFSLVSFASVVLLSLLAFEADQTDGPVTVSLSGRMRGYIYFVITYMYFVVYTGAFVKHTGASSVCRGWPLCNGQLIPPLEGRVAVQFGHRVAAALLFIVILIMLVQLWKKYKTEKVILWVGILSFILVSIQVASGAVVLFTGFTLWATLFHALFVSLLFAVLSYGVMIVSRK
ncbi:MULTISPECIES: COX15/CtaA family protein [Alteribacter]|uniref:Heme A synthase n=1 Tax=Alteribacter keqinensis TaxID=2483800 RepID=A0A3M7TVY4_9BACI|nr:MULTISPECIES: heme A synthase [Alteribacter]MBM7095907.1 heme A synthase [Alteribacter salitolerans]RNA69728.1 heme A synthase [Alteribacter keqinensis]